MSVSGNWLNASRRLAGEAISSLSSFLAIFVAYQVRGVFTTVFSILKSVFPG